MMKHYIVIFGIVITIIGWLISNASHFPFVYRIVAPRYSNAISALDKMRQKDYILRKGESGFLEISDLLKKFIKGKRTLIITKIRTLNWEKRLALMRTTKGAEWCDYYIELEISFSNSQPITAEFYDLKLLIEEVYLRSVFLWSSIIFWIGIVVSLIGFILEVLSKTKWNRSIKSEF